MKKKISNRDLNLLMVLLGVVIFLVLYFAVYLPLQEKNEKLERTLSTQSVRLEQLQNYYDDLPAYEKGISDSKVEIEAALSRLPGGLKDEDTLLYLMDMHRKAGSKLTSVSFDSVSLIGQFNCMLEDEAKVVSGYRAVSTATAEMTYGQVKQCIDHIYDTADLTFLDSLSVTYDSETALLDTVMTMSKLYAEYDGCVYTPAEVPDVALSLRDPFGTTSH